MDIYLVLSIFVATVVAMISLVMLYDSIFEDDNLIAAIGCVLVIILGSQLAGLLWPVTVPVTAVWFMRRYYAKSSKKGR